MAAMSAKADPLANRITARKNTSDLEKRVAVRAPTLRARNVHPFAYQVLPLEKVFTLLASCSWRAKASVMSLVINSI